jgi:PD-(D/E)XK nuclease superfamily
MDLIEIIKAQINQIEKYDGSIYLEAISLHLERAEYYYNEGRKDSGYFNDVIYRTNQSFEGALREAYKVLAEKTQEDVARETPYRIERYLENEGIFKERVLELFKNYRSEWRNKSTHDYQLFFDESEAFIALISVSSFVHLLLKQITEKIASKIEIENIQKSKTRQKRINDIINSTDDFTEVITSMIKDFFTSNKAMFKEKMYESEIHGMLFGYFTSLGKGLDVNTQGIKDSKLRPDFVIGKGNQSVVVELKRFGAERLNKAGIHQVLAYMKALNLKNGILLNISDDVKISNFSFDDVLMESEGTGYMIRIIQI